MAKVVELTIEKLEDNLIYWFNTAVGSKLGTNFGISKEILFQPNSTATANEFIDKLLFDLPLLGAIVPRDDINIYMTEPDSINDISDTRNIFVDIAGLPFFIGETP